MKGNKSQKSAILDQAAESLDEATACLDEYTGRLDSTAVLMDGGTDLTDKGARILDSATESLDYGSRGMPRRAGFTHGNFGFGVRFFLDDANMLQLRLGHVMAPLEYRGLRNCQLSGERAHGHPIFGEYSLNSLADGRFNITQHGHFGR